MAGPDDAVVRDYRVADEASWLECRLLGFFPTSYFDDVHTEKTRFDSPAVELVAATESGTVLGLLDVEIAGELATIDCVVVRPGADRAGIATRLFDEALRRLPADVMTVDAWTREDAPANGWYLRQGFSVGARYLHVYLDEGDPRDGFAAPDGLSLPVKAFLHAPKRMERFVRERYRRVHECRRYVRAR